MGVYREEKVKRIYLNDYVRQIQEIRYSQACFSFKWGSMKIKIILPCQPSTANKEKGRVAEELAFTFSHLVNEVANRIYLNLRD